MRRKGLLLILCSILLALLLPTQVEATAEMTPLSDFEYSVQTDGTVLLTKYIGSDSVVTIPDGYTIQGVKHGVVLSSNSIFWENEVITDVTIGSNVGFKNNSMRGLFAKCASLRIARMNGLDTKDISDMAYVFAGCESLYRIEGYSQWETGNVETIAFMFESTETLDRVDISNWDLSKLRNSGWCFQSCGAREILLPESLAVISAGFLNHANAVDGEGFTVPSGVKQVGYAHTFYDFATDRLASIHVAEGNTAYKSVDGILYSADGREMLAIPRAKTFPDGVYVIPESVEFLGELSFSRNYNVTRVVLPDSYRLSYVAKNDPAYILYEDIGNLNAGLNLHIAIYIYTGVTEYAVNDTNPLYQSRDGVIYSKDMTTLLAVPTRYERMLEIPEGVTTWESGAMWCAGTISYSCMKNCPGVSIPATMLHIGEDQLKKLNWLETEYSSFQIHISKDNPHYYVDADGQLRQKPMIGDMPITMPQESFIYDGTPKQPLPEIRKDQRVLELGKDYTLEYVDNIAAGTASVIITAKGDQMGSAQCSFTILPAEPKFEAPDAVAAVYGQKLKDVALPEFFVWSDEETTVGDVGEHTCYAVYWNQDPNYARVENVAIAVKVMPKKLEADTIQVRSLDFWSCEEICPAVRIFDGETEISQDAYTVQYENNFWCGKGTVLLSDAPGGNYEVSGSAYFWILPGPFFWTGCLLLLWLCTTGRVLRRSIKQPNCEACHEKSGDISQQSSGDGVASPADPSRTEVDADRIEDGLSGPQHDGSGPADGRVHTITNHEVCTDCKGSTATDGADQNENGRLRRNAKKIKYGRKKLAKHVDCSGSAEHTDSCEQQDQ